MYEIYHESISPAYSFNEKRKKLELAEENNLRTRFLKLLRCFSAYELYALDPLNYFKFNHSEFFICKIRPMFLRWDQYNIMVQCYCDGQ